MSKRFSGVAVAPADTKFALFPVTD